MIQVTPDCHCLIVTAKEFKSVFQLLFKGPGLYTTDEQTILVVAHEKDLEYKQESAIWKQTWPSKTLFAVYVYKVPFFRTIFSRVATAPVRTEY
jgi:hypothetical protein